MRTTEAWKNYRSAFEEFSLQARRVQSLLDQTTLDQTDTGQSKMEAALLAMERARRAYADARDGLAQQLAPSLSTGADRAETGNVRGIAELLWEVAGRPEGTAHQDWFRAEAIARRAAA